MRAASAARWLAEHPEFGWIGAEKLAEVDESRWQLAAVVVAQGYASDDPSVREILGLTDEAAQVAELTRRSKRAEGEPPPDTTAEQRFRRKAVQELSDFFWRLATPSRRSLAEMGRAAQLAHAERALAPQRHPRAHPLGVRPAAPQAHAELAELQNPTAKPARDESTKPLPDYLGCPATQRNRRRRSDASAQARWERRKFARQDKLARRAKRAGNPLPTNPGGIKALPLHEGRLVREIMRSREAALRCLLSLPQAQRARVLTVMTADGRRKRFSAAALRRLAWFQFLLLAAQAQRPSMAHDGFDKCVEGLCREALVEAFPHNADTREPYHANSASNWTREFEELGLIVRTTGDGYRGTSGWTLSVYRFRTMEALRVLDALALPLEQADGEVSTEASRDGPSPPPSSPAPAL